MKLEDQVTSLELSKRLKELGAKQESFFYWHNDSHKLWTSKHPDGEAYSAFSVPELGEMLPHNLPECYLQILKNHENNWMLSYVINEDLHPKYVIIGKTECDVRAKMLIFLLKNGIIK